MNHKSSFVAGVSALFVCLQFAGPSLMNADENASVCPRLASKLAANQPVTIVCLGDSVTGVYYHTGGHRAYPEMVSVALRQVYPQAKIKLVNAGLSGDSTTGGLKRLSADVLTHKPNLVTVMFGLNDMVRVPLEEYRTNLQTIIKECRAAEAEVLLCTPNAVIDSGGRPTSKLIEYCDAMKLVGQQLNVPVCDCYAAHEALRNRDPLAWRLVMSDAIHPNMDGHKLNAVAICRSITGREISLQDAAPLQPAVSKTIARLKASEPLRVLAMSPYDKLISKGLVAIQPNAKVEVTPWPTEGQSLSQIEETSKTVRAGKYDLVLVAVPLEVTPTSNPPSEAAIASYTWILNWSLSFGHQEWDVVAIAPSVLHAKLSTSEQRAEDFARRLIAAQDLSVIARSADEQASAETIVEQWFRSQLTAE